LFCLNRSPDHLVIDYPKDLAAVAWSDEIFAACRIPLSPL